MAFARQTQQVVLHQVVRMRGQAAQRRDGHAPRDQQRVVRDGALIAEIFAADVLVLGSPMYNFGMTVQLKSWFDAIARR
jgi:FMN-dependent NADH-azoreductase